MEPLPAEAKPLIFANQRGSLLTRLRDTGIKHPWLIALALTLATVVAYRDVGAGGFVNLDDDAYVETQPMVNQGLRPVAWVWAWTSVHSSNWHPLTSLSHMFDCDLFGLRPSPMHWENLGWHLLNTILVFFVWRSLTSATWRSALVAALFDLHPLHVESVAWISERKDVLHTCFWLLGIGAYVQWVRKPSLTRASLVGVCATLALLAKPMAVTFPATLLLLDFWPLGRWPKKSWRALVWEKIPLFALAAIHSVVTVVVQHTSGAANYAQRFSLAARAENAVVAYVRYLGKTLWPESLSAFYHHPGFWPAWIFVGALALLATASVWIWSQRAARPWWIFGWLWFIGTLLPVIGLAQVGAQSMADRYTYVPLLGIFTAIAWTLAALSKPAPRTTVAIVGAVLFCCVVLTARQVRAWRNSVELYSHSIAVGEDNATVRYLLAGALQAAGRPDAEIVAQYRRALSLQPDYVNALTQLAIFSLRAKRIDEARQLIEESIRFEPANPGLHKNLGAVLQLLGRPDEARREFEVALNRAPDDASAHHELAVMALDKNQIEEARPHLMAMLHATPWDPDALCELGALLANVRQLPEARACLERALWIRPNFPRALENLRALERVEKSLGLASPTTPTGR